MLKNLMFNKGNNRPPLSEKEARLKEAFYAELVKVVSLTDGEETFCKKFKAINEAPEKDLTDKQIKKREEYRLKLANNKGLADKYYQYHLRETFGDKWALFPLKEIIAHFYRNSKTLAGLYIKVTEGK